ncbi:putative kelch repeat protein [Rosellinia necatrix]|uniref:Putative kelch repeat protein n=1 Tax=Rosellinia necatrix TaxID=77044 RepID=A0A1W2TX20_ROSNE|nr:putative kelch repeat protein [Rosellinia necatrix]
MYRATISVLVTAILAGLPSWVDGQQSGWVPNQVSATMCAWTGLRAAQLKDTAYLDGGFLYWVAGLADGSTKPAELDGNPLSIIYKLNFSTPFNASTNFSSIMVPLYKAGGGSGSSVSPNYFDGAMLANDHEFVLYGGLIRKSSDGSPPGPDKVEGYRVSDYGIEKPAFTPGLFLPNVPENMTRYVTFGGAANAPSENKAWYFGGYRSPSWGPIYQPGAETQFNPTNLSNTLITLDLAVSRSEAFTNTTLDPSIPSRANPSVVWVPVGAQGILVVVGGVSYPDYLTFRRRSENEAQSEKESPGFMINIDIYDVAGDNWYQQSTKGAPSQRTKGCAVVATAPDGSSHNIYYYGGYDGLHKDQDYLDEVWVLSIPSFTWTKISESREGYARAGHQCLTPYPDQMVVIGGGRAQAGPITCLVSMVEVFNLTSGQWQDGYDPSVWGAYGVPEAVHQVIGGGYDGGATVTTPMPTGWDSPSLASVFATTYPASKITTYYPYSSQGSVDNDGGRGEWNDGDSNGGSKGGIPSWVAPVLGVVLGLIFITAVVVAVLLYKRRHIFKRSDRSEPAVGRGYDVVGWLRRGAGSGEKLATTTTEDPSTRFGDPTESRNETPMTVGIGEAYRGRSAGEMPAPPPGPHELTGTSQPVELYGGAMSYMDSPHPGSSRSPLPPSAFPRSAELDQHNSLDSPQATMTGSSTIGELRDFSAFRNLNQTRTAAGAANRGTMVSDMSRTSDHQRNLSDGTVSTTSNVAPTPPASPPMVEAGFAHHHGNAALVSPSLSATSEFASSGGDYMSSRYQSMAPTTAPYGNGYQGHGQGATSPSRMSAFRENQDDLGDSPTLSHTREGTR